MIIHNRQHLLALLAIAAIALLAADRLLLSPLADSWKSRASQIRDLKQSLARGQALLERREFIRKRWDAMRAQTLPEQVSTAEDLVLKAFDRWANDSRASIGSIRPQWKSIDPEHTLLECRADATGNLSALSRFIYELEKDPLALRVERLELTSADPTGQTLTLTLQLSALLLNAKSQP